MRRVNAVYVKAHLVAGTKVAVQKWPEREQPRHQQGKQASNHKSQLRFHILIIRMC